MSFAEIIMLAIALSVDACVVSFSYGILPLKNPLKDSVMLAVFTGGFQALMPVAGFLLTGFAYDYILPYAKLIVFAIFVILGIKFITEAYRGDSDNKKELCISVVCLFMVGIATSIDAFAGGISLRLSENTILYPAFIIGLTTFINSMIGFHIGKNIKHMPVMFMEIMSGIILISLGIKALF